MTPCWGCRTCYGLLMLLPQSEAFKTLHTRLHSVPTQALLHMGPSREAMPGADPSAEGGPLQAQGLIDSFKACLVRNWVCLLMPRACAGRGSAACLSLQEQHTTDEEARRRSADPGELAWCKPACCAARCPGDKRVLPADWGQGPEEAPPLGPRTRRNSETSLPQAPSSQ